jgi:hypothetical protein
MIIEMSKQKPGSELLVKFTLPNNHFIIFSGEELTDSKGIFTVEIKADDVFQEWLINRINKPPVDPDYYKPKV